MRGSADEHPQLRNLMRGPYGNVGSLGIILGDGNLVIGAAQLLEIMQKMP
jgi:hypothetical protein